MRRTRSALLPLLLLVLLALPAAALQSDGSPGAPQMAEFLRARLAADRGDTDRALEILDRLIAEEEDPILLYERGRLLLELRRFDAAEKDLRRSIAIDPALADSRRTLGRLLLDRSRNDGSRIDEALENLTVAYQLNPNDIATGLTIAQVYNGTGRSERAITVLEGLLERMPDNRSVNHQYAQILLQQGRDIEAIPYLEVVVSGEPFYEPAAAQLVDLYEQDGDWESSVLLLERWNVHDPTNIEIRKRLGFVQLRAGEPDDAVETLEWVMEQVSGDLGLEYLYAEALAGAGRAQEAEGYYESLLARDPSSVDLLVSYALNQMQLEKYESAARRFRALARRADVSEPIRALALTQLGAISHRSEDWDAALRFALDALELEAPNTQALGIALDVFERQERYDEAIALIERRRKAFPNSAMLSARLFQFQRLDARERAARRTLTRLLNESEESALFAVQVLGQLEEWEEAASTARKALEKWGGDTISLLFQLGASLERSGEYDDSVVTFRKLLSIEPDHAPSQNYLGYMWADRGENLEEARVLIEKAVEADPDNGAYVDSLGWVHYKLGNLDLAEQNLSRAADLEPDDPTILEHLGDVNALLGRLDVARKHYTAALELDPEDPKELRSKLNDIEERLAQAGGEVN